MKAREIYECATSYTKIKSQQIVEALYTEFTPWQGLLDFQPVLRPPTGTNLTFQHDPAIIVGVGRFQDHDVAIIAQQTPPSMQARKALNYGLVQADGYGLALCMMNYAERYGLMLHTFIDTVGGDPFEDAAAKLRSWLIARCQAQMLNLSTPSISTIIGQGGSGGAIALQLAHRRYMLALSTYSVIAPEGCAAILFRDVNEKTIAAAVNILQPTATYMLKYGIVDGIVEEPPLDDPEYAQQTLEHLQQTLEQATTALTTESMEDLQQELHEKAIQCGRVSTPQPWYKRAQHLTKRLWGLSRPTITTDPHIASIRRHLFGDPDCIPHACNTVSGCPKSNY